MTYQNCMYNTQGYLICKTKKEDNIETFINAKLTQIKNNGFTEISTSTLIWDKNSAKEICEPICNANSQKWNGGYRSSGGSVCYCINK